MTQLLNDTIDKKGESLDSDELLEIIDHDLDSARQLHDEQMDRIQSWIDQYEGEPYGNEVDGRSRIVWKLAKKQGEARTLRQRSGRTQQNRLEARKEAGRGSGIQPRQAVHCNERDCRYGSENGTGCL